MLIRIYKIKPTMENINNFGSFVNESVNESSMWSRIFGKPNLGDAKHDTIRSKKWSQTGRDSNSKDKEDNYIMFNGKKFYLDQIEYDDYHSTKPIPREENGKLIIANPAWSL